MKKKKSVDWVGWLRPGWVSVLLTLVVLGWPLITERAPAADGGYSVVTYRPIFLLAIYLQMGEWWPFLLMVGYSGVVYVVVSGVCWLLRWRLGWKS